MTGLFSVLVRFLHLGSVAGLVGGILYARAAVMPALSSLPLDERARAAQQAQGKFRPLLVTMLVLVVLSGLYNGFGPGAPHHEKQWHMWFGIKMLAVLHFLTTAVLWSTSAYGDVAMEAKANRRLTGLLVSGFIAILIGNYMRYLTAHGL